MADALLATVRGLQQKIDIYRQSWPIYLASVRPNRVEVDVNASKNTRMNIVRLEKRCRSVGIRLVSIAWLMRLPVPFWNPSIEDRIINILEPPLGTETHAHRLEVAIGKVEVCITKEELCTAAEDAFTDAFDRAGEFAQDIKREISVERIVETCALGARCRARREEAEDTLWRAGEDHQSLDSEVFEELQLLSSTTLRAEVILRDLELIVSILMSHARRIGIKTEGQRLITEFFKQVEGS